MSSEKGVLLVVDDDEMNRDMLSWRLLRKGYTVSVAASGAEALEMAARQNFDVVLLDIMMPNLNGMDVLRMLRQMFLPSQLAVIMVTAKGESDDVVQALELGANDYVTKPIDFPVALARIQTQISRKRAEESLRKHLLAMEASMDGMAILNAVEEFTYVNDAFVKIYDCAGPAELLGKPWRAVCDDAEGKRFAQEILPILWRQGRWRGECRGKRCDGSAFPQETSLAAISGGGFIAVVRDITERQRAEEELRQARLAAEAANRAKSEFLANMSHEIRTPMAGILGMTELALGTELTAEQRQYLEMVKGSGDSLLTVINDILDFSKIEAGKLELEAIDFDLRERLGDRMKALGLRAHTKELELVFHCADEVPDSLIGDPGRLGQVVINLVGNAIKFTSQGEVVMRVAVESLTEDQTRLHFTIRDTGVGIAADKLGHIFEAFSQADNSTTRQYGGTGLGLTISSKLVAMMGGVMWVESEIGRGSLFHFTVLFRVSPVPDPHLIRAAPESLRDLSVLIVDDNASNRCILSEVVSRWRMKPTAVGDGSAAIAEMKRAAAAGQPYALVLGDAVMPQMDGFAMVQAIKQQPELSGTLLLMLSSADQQRDAARCRQLGIAGYLIKPVKPSELLNALLTAIGAREALHERAPAASTQRRPEETPPDAPRPLRILVAEDNFVNQRLAITLLSQKGHAVVTANDGKQALDLLGFTAQESGVRSAGSSTTSEFDVVLMDVQMPEMDGFEATARIRAAEQQMGRHIPIIAMTAHAMKGDRERCLAAGMDDYVSKPVQASELYQSLARLPLPARSKPVVHAETAAVVELDVDAILARVGGNEELLQQIVALFQKESALLLHKIRAAVAGKQSLLLEKTAHSLKGSAGLFDVCTARAALTLEEIGRSENLKGAEEALALLERELGRLGPALARLTAKGRS